MALDAGPGTLLTVPEGDEEALTLGVPHDGHALVAGLVPERREDQLPKAFEGVVQTDPEGVDFELGDAGEHN
jgi:hypothetical protein